MIDAVTFDFWGTVVIDTPEFDNMRKRERMEGVYKILRNHGFNINLETLYEAYDKSWQMFEKIWSTNKEIGSIEQIKMLLELADSKITDKVDSKILLQLEQPYCGAVLKKVPRLVEGVDNVLRSLRSMNLKIGLICNTGRTPGRFLTMVLERWGIKKYFNALIYSDEIGARKPSPSIFLIALEKLRASPSLVAHVGDDLWIDVYGAKQVGMKTVWVTKQKKQKSHVQPDATIEQMSELIEVLKKM